MSFLKTKDGWLLSLAEVSRISSIEGEDKSCRVMALLRSGEVIELNRLYTLENLGRVLDPLRASR